MKSKIVILGSSGLLGQWMVRYMHKHHLNTVHLDRRDIDATWKFNKIEQTLTKYISCGDIIINCIGVLKPTIRRYEISNFDVLKINHIFPLILELVSEKKKAKVIHFSSDCIFNGVEGNYDEDCIPDSRDIYGISKNDNHLTKTTVIRTSFIGLDKRDNAPGLFNFIYSNKHVNLNGYINCLWNGVTTLELCTLVDFIIRGGYFWKGSRHIFSDRVLSKYELLCLINDIFKLNKNIKSEKALSIEGTKIDNILDRSLSTKHTPIYKLATIEKQLENLKQWIQ